MGTLTTYFITVIVAYIIVMGVLLYLDKKQVIEH